MLLSKLKPNPDNPRIIKDGKFKQLVQSIKDFPQMMALRPIIYDSKMVVLGGNMRLAALKELGYKELPDEWVKPAKGLTDDQKREFIVKDNVGFGEWNWEQIANEWDTDLLKEWGMDLPNIFDQDVDAVNEETEYIGMPEFEAGENPLRIVINFNNEDDRNEFVKITKMDFVKKLERTWTTIYPFRERQDLNSLKYESSKVSDLHTVKEPG
jgi:hypothetical protein